MAITDSKRSPETAAPDRLTDITRYSEIKRLIYAIAALQQQRNFRSLAVLSSLPGEGKTLFCAVLARAYIETFQSRVLVVDTTTFHHAQSLVLRHCIHPSLSGQIDILPLEKKSGTNGTAPPFPSVITRARPAYSADPMKNESFTVALTGGSDQSLVREAAVNKADQYGLILLDTVPLTAKNKHNIDPLLVARIADASVLIVSRKFLNHPQLTASLKTLEDPALHLIGIVSNEEFSQ